MRKIPGLGGLGDMQKLVHQAQKMQEDATKLQEEMPNMRIEASAGGGMVRAVVDGLGHLVEIKINPAVVDAADVEMLEDLILIATKEAVMNATAQQETKMKDITGALGELNIPPGILG